MKSGIYWEWIWLIAGNVDLEHVIFSCGCFRSCFFPHLFRAKLTNGPLSKRDAWLSFSERIGCSIVSVGLWRWDPPWQEMRDDLHMPSWCPLQNRPAYLSRIWECVCTSYRAGKLRKRFTVLRFSYKSFVWISQSQWSGMLLFFFSPVVSGIYKPSPADIYRQRSTFKTLFSVLGKGQKVLCI